MAVPVFYRERRQPLKNALYSQKKVPDWNFPVTHDTPDPRTAASFRT